ncbi:MAG TPA: TRZ/ATZ family hydrolase [Gammaproteobacteria bacterium]|nr:TRZ/ATZ family hydrolase [Gammaproteobacteria bacterium]
MKKSVDSILKCRWLVPVRPAHKIYEHSGVVIHRRRILDVGPLENIKRQYEAKHEVDLSEHLLIPGLVNSHTHAAMSLFQGIADDMEMTDWLKKRIWPLENRWISPDFVRIGSQLAIAQMLKSGTTCFNDMYFFADHTMAVVEECGIRASLGLIVIDAETAWARDLDEYLSKAGQLHDASKQYSLVSTAFAPHAPYSLSDDSLQNVRVRAEELGLPIHIHLQETAQEVTQSLELFGKTPIQRLKQLELLSPSLQAVHVTQCNEEDLHTLAEYGVHILHCPESNLKLASGFCPVTELKQRGINVALGTDGSASNNDLDMLGEMRTAALLAKGVSQDATAVDAFSALEMATINGAKALGMEEEIGSIEPHKSADLVALHLDNIETQPLYSALSQIVYSAGRHLVTDVWVAGDRIVADRKLTRMDETTLLREVRHWQTQLNSN